MENAVAPHTNKNYLVQFFLTRAHYEKILNEREKMQVVGVMGETGSTSLSFFRQS